MTAQPVRRRTADVVGELLGLNITEADQLVAALGDHEGAAQRAARETVISLPTDYRQAMALREIGHAIDAVSDRADSAFGAAKDAADLGLKLQEAHDRQMRGEATECRGLTIIGSTLSAQIAAQETKLLRWIVVTFVGAVALSVIIGVLAWSLGQAVAAAHPFSSAAQGAKP